MFFPRDLKLELVCDPKNQLRALHQPWVDVQDPTKPMLVASNGRVVVAVAITLSEVEARGLAEVAGMIPIEAIKAARKSKTFPQAQMSLTAGSVSVDGVSFPRTHRANLSCPDYRQVTPPAVRDELRVGLPLESLAVAHKLIGRFGCIARIPVAPEDPMVLEVPDSAISVFTVGMVKEEGTGPTWKLVTDASAQAEIGKMDTARAAAVEEAAKLRKQLAENEKTLQTANDMLGSYQRGANREAGAARRLQDVQAELAKAKNEIDELRKTSPEEQANKLRDIMDQIVETFYQAPDAIDRLPHDKLAAEVEKLFDKIRQKEDALAEAEEEIKELKARSTEQEIDAAVDQTLLDISLSAPSAGGRCRVCGKPLAGHPEAHSPRCPFAVVNLLRV